MVTLTTAIVAIALCAWWGDLIDRGTILALGLGWLAGGFMARYHVHLEAETERQALLRKDYERAKRRGIEL